MSNADYTATIVGPDELASGAWTKLTGGSALVALLGSGNRIWKGRPPKNAPTPLVVVAVGGITGDVLNTAYGQLDVGIRMRNPNDGAQPSGAQFDAISREVRKLLEGRGTMTRTGIRFFDCVWQSTSQIFQDVDVPEESWQTVRFWCAYRRISG